MIDDATQPALVIDALADSSSPDWDQTLGDTVRFRSPYADYAGLADVAHLLDLVREVLVEVRTLRTLRERAITLSLFDARVGDEEVQGMLFEQHDDAGRLVDATLTIRPYSGLREAMREMQSLLAASPLPSAAGSR